MTIYERLYAGSVLNKRRYISFPLFVLFLSIALIVSGCGSDPSQTPTADQNTAASLSPGEKIKLTIWVIETTDTFLYRLAEDYEQDHPKIDVIIREIPAERYAAQLEEAVKAGSAPDLASIVQPEWLAAGYFHSLDETITNYRVPFDDFNTGAITRNCVYQGRVFCLGTLTSGIILVYNKDVFDLFGVSYPSANEPLSFEEYHHLIIRLTQKSSKLEERIWGGVAAPFYEWVEPGTHVSPDGRKIAGFLNDEATTKAYQWMADAYRQGASPSPEEAEQLRQTPLDLLIAGRQATILADSASVVPILEQSGIRWGCAIVPAEQKGDAKWSSNRTDGLGVTITSPRPDEALDFLVFYASHGNRLRLEQGGMPLNMRLAEQWASGSEERRQVFEALRYSRPYPFIPGFAEAAQLIWQAWAEMTEKDIPAKKALDGITSPMQEILDQAWKEFEAIQPYEFPSQTPLPP